MSEVNVNLDKDMTKIVEYHKIEVGVASKEKAIQDIILKLKDRYKFLFEKK